MAAAAVAMQEKGYLVTGSDKNVYDPMAGFLKQRCIEVDTDYSEANLARKPDLVVIGNAISRGNPEAEAVLERKLTYCSLPELLKYFFIRGKRSIVVAGTHGKTTTTSLLTWVFEHNGLNPSYLIGGIPNNFSQGARFTDSEWFILEGDEYDTAFFDKRSKFIHYLPEVAILNNLEFDHADIFGSVADIQLAFKRFINIIPRNGLVVANGDDPNLAPLLGVKHCPIQRFGLGEANEWRASAIELQPEQTLFEVNGVPYSSRLLGELNVRNALGVIAACLHCGLTHEQIQSAFGTFKGVKRRMEVRGVAGGVTVVDDFGHHPTAIRETLRALRVKYAGHKIWAVFEPRSNTTRRNVFQGELVSAFADADAVVVSQIARLELLQPSERLDPGLLMQELKASGKTAEYLPDADSIVEHLGHEVHVGDVVCVFTNGGFGDIHNKLLKQFEPAPGSIHHDAGNVIMAR